MFQFPPNNFNLFSIWLSKVWNCWSINLMIRDKSSGYGWGNGMMYVKGNTGGKIKTNKAITLRGFGMFTMNQVNQIWKLCHIQKTTKMAGSDCQQEFF